MKRNKTLKEDASSRSELAEFTRTVWHLKQSISSLMRRKESEIGALKDLMERKHLGVFWVDWLKAEFKFRWMDNPDKAFAKKVLSAANFKRIFSRKKRVEVFEVVELSEKKKKKG